MSTQHSPEGSNEEAFKELARRLNTLNKYEIPEDSSILYCASLWEERRELGEVTPRSGYVLGTSQKTDVDKHTCRLYDIRRFLCEEEWIGSTGATLEMCVPDLTVKLLSLFKETFPEMLSEMEVIDANGSKRTFDGDVAACDGFRVQLTNMKPAQKNPSPDEEDTSNANNEKLEHEGMWRALLEQPSALFVEPNRLHLRREQCPEGQRDLVEHLVMDDQRLIHLAIIQRAKSLMNSRAMLEHQTTLLVQYLHKLSGSQEEFNPELTDMKTFLVSDQAKALWAHLDNIISQVDKELLLLRALLVVIDDLTGVVVCFQCKELIAVIGRKPARDHCKQQLVTLAVVEEYEKELETLRVKLDEQGEESKEGHEICEAISKIEAKVQLLMDQLTDGGRGKKQKEEAERVVQSNRNSQKMASKIPIKQHVKNSTPIPTVNANESKKGSAAQKETSSVGGEMTKEEYDALERLMNEESSRKKRGKKNK